MRFYLEQISATLMEVNLDSMRFAVMAEDGKPMQALQCLACMADTY